MAVGREVHLVDAVVVASVPVAGLRQKVVVFHLCKGGAEVVDVGVLPADEDVIDLVQLLEHHVRRVLIAARAVRLVAPEAAHVARRIRVEVAGPAILRDTVVRDSRITCWLGMEPLLELVGVFRGLPSAVLPDLVVHVAFLGLIVPNHAAERRDEAGAVVDGEVQAVCDRRDELLRAEHAVAVAAIERLGVVAREDRLWLLEILPRRGIFRAEDGLEVVRARPALLREALRLTAKLA
mmetsp:Transcript_11127/g.36551  ORF Transcript_11127/g.36551 Transcript_11127/m.36551 type:complete len:237 (+) Transcript_11127:749-1459(+)